MSAMRYRVLGASGMKVSQLCLGTMLFGGPTPEADARRIIDDAADRGVKYRVNQKAEAGSRAARQDKRMLEAEWRTESLLIAEKLEAHAKEITLSPACPC